MKRFWVYWDIGSCEKGNHSVGIDCFDTVEEAVKKRDQLLNDAVNNDKEALLMIFEGKSLEGIPVYQWS